MCVAHKVNEAGKELVKNKVSSDAAVEYCSAHKKSRDSTAIIYVPEERSANKVPVPGLEPGPLRTRF